MNYAVSGYMRVNLKYHAGMKISHVMQVDLNVGMKIGHASIGS